MSLLKCKMCGGTMEVLPEEGRAVCEYCGTVLELPHLNNEEKAVPQHPSGKTNIPLRNPKLLIGIAILAVLCLSALLGFRLMPGARYSRAETLAEAGEYDKAIAIWSGMIDREGAEEAIRQARYDKGLYLLEQGRYEEAVAALEELSGTRDVRTELREARYGYACLLTDAGQYEQAWNLFELVGSDPKGDAVVSRCQEAYAEQLLERGEWITAIALLGSDPVSARAKATADTCYLALAEQFCGEADYLRAEDCLSKVKQKTIVSMDLDRAVAYGRGQQLLEEKAYLEAVARFEHCGNYENAAELRKEAMYGYVCENKDPDNETTCAYLDELLQARYRDSADLYREVRHWKLDVYAISTNQNDDSTLLTTVNKYNKMYFFCRLSGGMPGTTTTVNYKIYWLSGSMTPGELDGVCRSGDTGYHTMWYSRPKPGETGIHRVEYFDNSGNLIGSASVNIVD